LLYSAGDFSRLLFLLRFTLMLWKKIYYQCSKNDSGAGESRARTFGRTVYSSLPKKEFHAP